MTGTPRRLLIEKNAAFLYTETQRPRAADRGVGEGCIGKGRRCFCMLKIACVEDDAAEAAQLKSCLDRYAAEHGLALETCAFATADQLLAQYDPAFDILFLDVEMPGTSGMQAARQLRRQGCEAVILFITNIARYAVQGYEVEALDFILKPVNYPVFGIKMDRAVRRARSRAGHTVTLSLADGIRRLDVRQIYYLETRDRMLYYHTEQGAFALRGSLSAAEKELAPWHFARCNQCYLVNLRHVTGVAGDTVTVAGRPLEISRRCRAPFVAAVTAYIGGET